MRPSHGATSSSLGRGQEDGERSMQRGERVTFPNEETAVQEA